MAADAFNALAILGDGRQIPFTVSDVANAYFVNGITGENFFTVDPPGVMLLDLQCSEDGEDTSKAHLYRGTRDTGIYWFYASLLVSLSKRPLIPQQLFLKPGNYYIKQEA